jgi:hypothetical protein
MKIKTYDKQDSRWSRVVAHPSCVDVPNLFCQILFNHKNSISDIEGIKDAIETGTYQGDTTTFFAELFDNVSTVEKYVEKNPYGHPGLLAAYREIRKTHPNITFYSGDSVPFLVNALTDRPDTRFVILLDAHSPSYSPIIEELQAINEHSNIKNHVIIVDDAIDLNGPGWPTKEKFEEAVKQINRAYRIEYTDTLRKAAIIYVPVK